MAFKARTTSTRVSRKGPSFVANVIKLASGAAVAQAIAVVASPILTRLYAPEAFGMLTLFSSVTGILIAVSCLRYELSIMLPSSDEEAANLLAGSLLIIVSITLVSASAVIAFRVPFLHLLNSTDLGRFLWLVPVYVLAGGMILPLSSWNARTKRFGRLSVAQLIGATVVVCAQLALGSGAYATGGSLIVSLVMGSIVVVVILGILVWIDSGSLFVTSVKINLIQEQLRRYKKFPKYDAIAALLNNASWQLPAFLLAAYFSKVEVGYYALSFRALKLPMSLIGNALGQVFFQRAVEAKIQGRLAEIVESSFRRLVRFGMLPFFLLTFVGQDLFVLVFGANWSEAGIYTQILSLWIFCWFISSPMSTLFRVLERQEFSLVLNIVIFASRFLTLSIGGMLGSARLALVLFAVSGIGLYGYLSMSIVAAAGVPKAKIRQILTSNALMCLGVGLPLWLLERLHLPSWTRLLAVTLIIGVHWAHQAMGILSEDQGISQTLKSLGLAKHWRRF